MDKSLKVSWVVLLLSISILISFIFFCVNVTSENEHYIQTQRNCSMLSNKVDSLENVVKILSIPKKDTVIVKIQTLK